MEFDKILYETTYTELKQEIDFKSPKNWLKKICAFANGDRSGFLIIGVNDKTKEYCGVDNPDYVITKIRELTYTNIDPIIYPIITTKTINNKTLVIIEIRPGADIPYFLTLNQKQIVYVLNGNEAVPADRNKIKELSIKGSNLSWDTLKTNKVANIFTFDYLKNKFKIIKNEILTDKDLEEFGLIKDNKITNMGVLFSDQNDNPDSWISATIWNGLNKAQFAIDDKEWRGSILQQIDYAVDFCKNTNQKMMFFTSSPQRTEITAYDNASLREAVINAVAHRDYTINNNAQIEISFYDDRFEIKSIGKLYGNHTIEHLLTGVVIGRRNENICRILRELDYIEQRGRGIDKIINPYVENRLPEFKQIANNFILTIYSKIFNRTTPDTVNQSIFEDESVKKVYDLILKKPDIKKEEIATILDKNIRTIQRYLKKLKELKYIKYEDGKWIILDK